MTDELILGIVGLAVSAAQCVPLFSKGTSPKGKIVAAFTIVFVVAGASVWYHQEQEYERTVEKTKAQVLSELRQPKTFDQLLADLYYPSYETLADAVDELVDESAIDQRRILAVSRNGDTLDVRVYVLTSGDVRQAASAPQTQLRR